MLITLFLGYYKFCSQKLQCWDWTNFDDYKRFFLWYLAAILWHCVTIFNGVNFF